MLSSGLEQHHRGENEVTREVRWKNGKKDLLHAAQRFPGWTLDAVIGLSVTNRLAVSDDTIMVGSSSMWNFPCPSA